MLSFAAGDGDGFELLYKRHSPAVYRFFYFGTHGDSFLAAELFQDVWMTVVRGRVRYSSDISFTDWLYHSAWARLHDHLRLHPLDLVDTVEVKPVSASVTSINAHRSANDSLKGDDVAASSDTEHSDNQSISHVVEELTGEQTHNEATDRKLIASIRSMSPELKEVTLLRFCFSMSNQDIADFLDVAKPAVERSLREAVRLMREELEQSASTYVSGDTEGES